MRIGGSSFEKTASAQSAKQVFLKRLEGPRSSLTEGAPLPPSKREK